MRQCMSASKQSAADFAAGGVAMRVENARAAVCGLARESQFGAGAIEFRAPFDELSDVLGTFFHQQGYRFRPAESVAGSDGVLLVQADFVFVAEGNGDATLRICSCGFAQVGFCKDKNGARGAEFDGGTKARNT